MTSSANARIYTSLPEAIARIDRLESELERAATTIQRLHPIGQIKGIGLLEVGLAVEQLAECLPEIPIPSFEL